MELGGDKLNLKKDGEFQKWKRLEAEAMEEVLSKAVVDGKRLSDNIGLLDLLLMRIILLPLGGCLDFQTRCGVHVHVYTHVHACTPHPTLPHC